MASLNELRDALKKADTNLTLQKGAYNSAMANLKSLGYASVEDAEAALASLRQEAADLLEKANAAVKEIQENYPDLLS